MSNFEDEYDAKQPGGAEINSPVKSKINGVSIVSIAVALALKYVDWPAEVEKAITEAILFGILPLVVVLRTWFTAKRV